MFSVEKESSILAVKFTADKKKKRDPERERINSSFLIYQFEVLKKKPINEISTLAINIKGGKCANKTCFWKA